MEEPRERERVCVCERECGKWKWKCMFGPEVGFGLVYWAALTLICLNGFELGLEKAEALTIYIYIPKPNSIFLFYEQTLEFGVGVHPIH